MQRRKNARGPEAAAQGAQNTRGRRPEPLPVDEDQITINLNNEQVQAKDAEELRIAEEKLKQLRENKDSLRYTLLYYSELLKYKNRLNKGNFFITSDKEIYNNIKFAAKQLNKFWKYKAPSEWLEENIIIIGAKGSMNFDNPIIASPFIDKEEYEEFLKTIIGNKNYKLLDSYKLDLEEL